MLSNRDWRYSKLIEPVLSIWNINAISNCDFHWLNASIEWIPINVLICAWIYLPYYQNGNIIPTHLSFPCRNNKINIFSYVFVYIFNFLWLEIGAQTLYFEYCADAIRRGKVRVAHLKFYFTISYTWRVLQSNSNDSSNLILLFSRSIQFDND